MLLCEEGPGSPSGSAERRRTIAAGALLAIAILIKQQAAAFALFALLWTRFRRAGYRISGGAIVGVAAAVLLWIGGVFPRFWFWTVPTPAST